MPDEVTRTVEPQASAGADASTWPASLSAGGPAPASVDRYDILEELARGGMGIVYRARDPMFSRDVAVKLMHEVHRASPNTVRRFMDEATISGQLQHPGIPPVFEIGHLSDGSPFLAMKLIKGHTLDEGLKARPDPSADRGQYVAIFEKVCEAVGYAHAHGVIHRDLKPANVMVGAHGEVQVMDWGLAKVLTSRGVHPPGPDPDATLGTEIRPTRSHTDATQAGSLLGTPAFMPPEQAIGAIDQIDARSDVFGLGAILCMILTEKPPYVGADSESTRQLAARAKLDEAFSRLDASGAEPDLVALCRRCLSVEQSDRPTNAGEVAATVAKLRADADERARQAELERAEAEAETREQHKRRRVQVALAVAVGLILFVGSAFAWWWIEGDRATHERIARNAEAVAGLLDRCEEALRGHDADRAAVALDAAEKRAAEGGAEHLRARLDARRADLAALRDLEAADRVRWTPVAGELPNSKQDVARVRVAFERFGVFPGRTPADEAAHRVTASAIRDRLVAALDLWLSDEPSEEVRALLRAADPDVYRDALRDAIQARDDRRASELAARPEAAAQPEWFTAVLGEFKSVPVERRRELLLAAQRRRPTDLGLLMALGGTYPIEKAEGAAERVRWYQAAVTAAPLNPAPLGNLGAALGRNGDLDGAIACFNEAIRLDRTYAPAYVNLGKSLLDKGDLSWAEVAHREGIRLDASMAAAHDGLGVTLHARGDLDGAIASLTEATRLDPEYYVAHSNLGNVLTDKGDLDGAIRSCATAIRINPSFAPAYNNLGHALKTRGDLAGAVVAFREAVRLDPKFIVAHGNLGAALEAKRDFDGALAAYQVALRVHAGYSPAHYGLANVLMAQGNLDGAIASYLEAIRIDPKNASFHSNLGLAQRRKGNLAGAIAAFQEAIRINPNHVNAHHNLGVALRAIGDPVGAVTAYKEAVRINPNFLPANNNLAWLLAVGPDGVRDGKWAVEYARRGCELTDWKEPTILGTLAAALAEMGKFDKAIEYEKQALAFPAYEKQFGKRARGRLALYEQRQPYRDPLPRELAPPPRTRP